MRRTGTSYSHPLFILVAVATDLPAVRLGVSASRTMGTAVRRNRAKRRLREAFRPLMSGLSGGWDLIVAWRRRSRPGGEDRGLEAAPTR